MKVRGLCSTKMQKTLLIASYVAIAAAHDGHADQEAISGPHKALWYNSLPGDGGTQVCRLLLASFRLSAMT